MSKDTPTVKMARPQEPEAVRTTIVGGRPPGNGAIPLHIPRGLEVLIKKAAVDPAFKEILFEKRAEAAEAIGLKLEPAEAAMLNAVPAKQLEAIVANTKVKPSLRPAFLGCVGATMLAALGTTTTGCTEVPDEPREAKPGSDRISDAKIGSMRKIRLPTTGIQADRPETYREGVAFYVGGDAAGVETRRLEDIEYRLRHLFEYVEEEYDTLVRDEEAVPRGNILVKFTITADGKVESPEIMSNNTGFPDLGAKTIQLLKSRRFATVKEGSATVVYQLRLNVTNGPSTGVVNIFPLFESFGNIAPADGDPANRASSPQVSLGGTGIRPDTLTKRGK